MLFPTSGRFYIWRTPKEAYSVVPTVEHGRFCDGLGSNIVLQHSVVPVIILHGRITAREYVDRLGNQVHPSHDPDIISEQYNFPIQCPHSHSWNCSVTV
jgi:hypothetical protein